MSSTSAGIALDHIRRLAGTRRLAQPPDGQLLERFTAQRDETAFAALVRRHGPMVLNVCRSVLRHEQDAEDAFQATFLVLARKADSIRQPEAVAGWLYEVAYHIAVKAQADGTRRRAQERRAVPMAPADPTLDMTLRDLRRVLHEELQRLPDKYRLPLVLCYLEGASHEEAARQLGWSKGTVRGRVDRGREHLRRRLAARGVALSGLLCATTVAPRAIAAGLVDSVVRATVPSAVGGAAANTVSPRASALAEGVTRAMCFSKFKVVTAVLVVVGLLAGAGALARQSPSAGERPPVSPPAEVRSPAPERVVAKETPKPPAADDKDSVAYSGRVLGPAGRPVAGAKLYLTLGMGYLKRPAPSPVYGTTGKDGRFSFTVSRATFGDRYTVVTASAAKHGPAWVNVPQGHKRDSLMIRLVKDDAPITGQIVDLEGKPVRGATLTVLQIHAAHGEDLGAWLEAIRDKNARSGKLEHQYFKRYTIALCPKASTDARGNFRLTGIGRHRLVRAQLDGPTIASQQLCILTRPGNAIAVTATRPRPERGDPGMVTTYYGANFRLVVAPTRPIVGVVRDKDTRKPLAGVMIKSYKLANNPIHGMDIVRTTTDARGRYRLIGMPKGEDNKIQVVLGSDQPYIPAQTKVPDSPGLAPVTVDFALKRGVWIEGKITDKVTGKPVQGAVEYFALTSNPTLSDYPGFNGTHENIVVLKEDGSYRIAGLPGPGLIGVYSRTERYLRAPDRDDEFGTKESSLSTSPYIISFPSNYWALARINPAKGVAAVKRDVTLDPGWTFTGKVLGPDGKPLAGTQSFDVNHRHWWEQVKTAEFTGGFNPRQPRDTLFLLPEKGLIGVAQPPKKNKGSVTVRMGPGASATGRLIDAGGKPRAGVELKVSFRPRGWGVRFDYLPMRIKTDAKGQFQLGALVPGYQYLLSDGKDDVLFGAGLRAGGTKDLGDVRLKWLDE
jgi:RNA polymerase sigma factor (sigma-70 family)